VGVCLPLSPDFPFPRNYFFYAKWGTCFLFFRAESPRSLKLRFTWFRGLGFASIRKNQRSCAGILGSAASLPDEPWDWPRGPNQKITFPFFFLPTNWVSFANRARGPSPAVGNWEPWPLSPGSVSYVFFRGASTYTIDFYTAADAPRETRQLSGPHLGCRVVLSPLYSRRARIHGRVSTPDPEAVRKTQATSTRPTGGRRRCFLDPRWAWGKKAPDRPDFLGANLGPIRVFPIRRTFIAGPPEVAGFAVYALWGLCRFTNDFFGLKHPISAIGSGGCSWESGLPVKISIGPYRAGKCRPIFWAAAGNITLSKLAWRDYLYFFRYPANDSQKLDGPYVKPHHHPCCWADWGTARSLGNFRHLGWACMGVPASPSRAFVPGSLSAPRKKAVRISGDM